MKLLIQNWKFALLTLFFIFLTTGLGYWQLARAKQKTLLLETYLKRSQRVLSATELLQKADARFYQTALAGVYLNDKTLLLDNKIVDGQIGYEIYTPFQAEGLSHPILIDRGFLPIRNRSELPTIPSIKGQVKIRGLITEPPSYIALGEMTEKNKNWPLRVEFIDLNKLAPLTGALFPYVIHLAENNTGAFKIEWHIVTMGPERHRAYAVQWFALALTLLILFIIINRSKRA